MARGWILLIGGILFLRTSTAQADHPFHRQARPPVPPTSPYGYYPTKWRPFGAPWSDGNPVIIAPATEPTRPLTPPAPASTNLLPGSTAPKAKEVEPLPPQKPQLPDEPLLPPLPPVKQLEFGILRDAADPLPGKEAGKPQPIVPLPDDPVDEHVPMPRVETLKPRSPEQLVAPIRQETNDIVWRSGQRRPEVQRSNVPLRQPTSMETGINPAIFERPIELQFRSASKQKTPDQPPRVVSPNSTRNDLWRAARSSDR